MRILLHIGLPLCGSERIQNVLADKRERLARNGVLYPRAPGPKNHTRLYMAITDPDRVDPLRYHRGFAGSGAQATLAADVARNLQAEVKSANPDLMILSAAQFGMLGTRSELVRLKEFLAPISEDIEVVAHVDNPADMLARTYAEQIFEGRAEPLDRELGFDPETWWSDAWKSHGETRPENGVFAQTQAAPHWLDYTALIAFWGEVFGEDRVRLSLFDRDAFAGSGIGRHIVEEFGLPGDLGQIDAGKFGPPPAAATLTRGRLFNELILHLMSTGKYVLPRQVWRSLIADLAVAGDPLNPELLAPIAAGFEQRNRTLAERFGLDPNRFAAPEHQDWNEPDPTLGFRASQYLLAFKWRIDKATKEAQSQPAKPEVKSDLSASAREIMPAQAVQNFEKLRGSPFAPHNRLGAANEDALAAAYTMIEPRALANGSSGNVIVGCMKNEAPYIVEWVAYHRAIGVDNFLIYTNDCSDGTDAILNRLMEMGVLEHRDNTEWKGKSPQQHALNRALKEPVIQNAEWIIHIDVDEFINVRCGNGTLTDFFEIAPDATNIAMTWRLFGHNGVQRLSDEFVIDQFDMAAPKYCPKPHTAWGFKSMFRNIGAYAKISCHRPNKLDPGFKAKVKWVNGSGRDITRETAENGWRSSKGSVGYDLLQLNHYALRSADSFLIKRQRGRALHVDRSIGINYWIRMDWPYHRDITIKRNIPRLRAEYDRLMQDPKLAELHAEGLAWHKAKAEELHANPEFKDLYQQALQVKLTETERVAYALALDMET